MAFAQDQDLSQSEFDAQFFLNSLYLSQEPLLAGVQDSWTDQLFGVNYDDFVEWAADERVESLAQKGMLFLQDELQKVEGRITPQFRQDFSYSQILRSFDLIKKKSFRLSESQQQNALYAQAYQKAISKLQVLYPSIPNPAGHMSLQHALRRWTNYYTQHSDTLKASDQVQREDFEQWRSLQLKNLKEIIEKNIIDLVVRESQLQKKTKDSSYKFYLVKMNSPHLMRMIDVPHGGQSQFYFRRPTDFDYQNMKFAFQNKSKMDQYKSGMVFPPDFILESHGERYGLIRYQYAYSHAPIDSYYFSGIFSSYFMSLRSDLPYYNSGFRNKIVHYLFRLNNKEIPQLFEFCLLFEHLAQIYRLYLFIEEMNFNTNSKYLRLQLMKHIQTAESIRKSWFREIFQFTSQFNKFGREDGGIKLGLRWWGLSQSSDYWSQRDQIAVKMHRLHFSKILRHPFHANSTSLGVIGSGHIPFFQSNAHYGDYTLDDDSAPRNNNIHKISEVIFNVYTISLEKPFSVQPLQGDVFLKLPKTMSDPSKKTFLDIPSFDASDLQSIYAKLNLNQTTKNKDGQVLLLIESTLPIHLSGFGMLGIPAPSDSQLMALNVKDEEGRLLAPYETKMRNANYRVFSQDGGSAYGISVWDEKISALHIQALFRVHMDSLYSHRPKIPPKLLSIPLYELDRIIKELEQNGITAIAHALKQKMLTVSSLGQSAIGLNALEEAIQFNSIYTFEEDLSDLSSDLDDNYYDIKYYTRFLDENGVLHLQCDGASSLLMVLLNRVFFYNRDVQITAETGFVNSNGDLMVERRHQRLAVSIGERLRFILDATPHGEFLREEIIDSVAQGRIREQAGAGSSLVAHQSPGQQTKARFLDPSQSLNLIRSGRIELIQRLKDKKYSLGSDTTSPVQVVLRFSSLIDKLISQQIDHNKWKEEWRTLLPKYSLPEYINDQEHYSFLIGFAQTRSEMMQTFLKVKLNKAKSQDAGLQLVSDPLLQQLLQKQWLNLQDVLQSMAATASQQQQQQQQPFADPSTASHLISCSEILSEK